MFGVDRKTAITVRLNDMVVGVSSSKEVGAGSGGVCHVGGMA